MPSSTTIPLEHRELNSTLVRLERARETLSLTTIEDLSKKEKSGQEYEVVS
jgi:hypothetical protein